MGSKLKQWAPWAVMAAVCGFILMTRSSGSPSPTSATSGTPSSSSEGEGPGTEDPSLVPRPEEEPKELTKWGDRIPRAPWYGLNGTVPMCFDACVDCLERCRKTRGEACYFQQVTCYEVKMMCCRLSGAAAEPEGYGGGTMEENYGTSVCACGPKDGSEDEP